MLPQFKDKFVAYIDVLGFSSLVEKIERDGIMSLSELLNALRYLGTQETVQKLRTNGPSICPESSRKQKDLDFCVTQVSDCVVISCEVSPAGIINLVNHCTAAVYGLLVHGLMCRGYITRGNIFHHENQFIGTAFQNACKNERTVTAFQRSADEVGTPFVEIDSRICNYIESCDDKCVSMMFERCVEKSSKSTAIFPFKLMAHSFIVAGMGIKFEPEKEKESNNNMRKMLLKFKDNILSFVDKANPAAIAKVEHYLQALDNQLVVCDQIDDNIELLCSPFPRNRINKNPR